MIGNNTSLDNNKLPCVVTLNDINAVSKSRFKDKAVKLKHQICELNTSRTLVNTLTWLRTRHLRGMKIYRNRTTKYLRCRNCDPHTKLLPEHLFSCPIILAILQQISDCPQEDHYSDICLDLAEAVFRTFGLI